MAGNIIAQDSEMNMSNGIAGDRLTIGGDYTTGNNTWFMDGHLTGEGEQVSALDNVKITGDVIDKGVDQVWVNNLNTNNPTGQESLLMVNQMVNLHYKVAL